MLYATKKSAQAAARKAHGSEYATLGSVTNNGEGWEFVLNTIPEEAPVIAEPVAEEIVIAGSSEVLADEIGEGDPTDEETDESNAPQIPSLLNGLIGNMLGTEKPAELPATKPVAEKATGLVIEKDRPEQNGVKRPSTGGLCRAVWDACWAHQEETGVPPTAKEVKAIAEAKGWNANNASIEYYQWRKYNGISGRITKAPVVQTETKPAFGAAVTMSLNVPMFS